jgi:hypothetical protein
MRPYHYECIGMAVEYLLANYKQESIDLYIPNMLDCDKCIMNFFIDNYKDIIDISVVNKIFNEYNSIFFLTSDSYDKINLQCKYNSIGGIAHDNDYFIKIKSTDNTSTIIAENLTIRYMDTSRRYIPFQFRLLIDKDKYISMATLDKYNDIKYFFTGWVDQINLNSLQSLLASINVKMIFVYKRGNINTNQYKNIIFLNNINFIDLIYLFLTKKLIFYPNKNSIYQELCSGSFHLAASFNTPALIPEQIYKNHNLKLYPNFIPYNSNHIIIKHLKPHNHMLSFRNR